MPLFSYVCTKCGLIGRTLTPSRPKLEPCKACGGDFKFTDTGPTSRVIEVIDTGFMPRKVEVLSGVKDMLNDRGKTKKDDIV